MTDLRLVLFDVDGTLVDSQGHITASMDRAFESLSLTPPSREETLSILGLSLPQAMARLAPEAPTEALVEAYKAAYMALRQEGDERALSPLYPGMAEVLANLRARPEVLVGVATGKSRRGLDTIIEAHRLDWLVTRQCADDHPSKPHPSMVWTAMSETGVDADRTVVIGDTTFDLDMARAAGAKAIGVPWGYHPTSALTPLAHAMANTAEDLPRLVDDLI